MLILALTPKFTLKMLSKEAIKQNKTHKIIIMIEMGDLRRMGEELIEFYGDILKLSKL
jgi:predicted amino acid racemase